MKDVTIKTASFKSRILPGKISEGFWFVLPAVSWLLLVLLFPLLYSFYLSFMKELPGLQYEFNGLQNFAYVIKDTVFWRSLGNTLVFSVTSVFIAFIVGLALALLLNKELKGTLVFRILLFLPWMIAPVIAGISWRWMFNGSYGLVNAILRNLGLLSKNIAWLGEVQFAMPSVIIANVWRSYPTITIMLLAGLKAIPGEQYEAATIDGAGKWNQFRYITLPNLKPVILVSTTLQFIWSFRLFDIVWTMTKGGPSGSTEVLSTLVYCTGFQFYDFPMASAISTLMVVIVSLLIFVYIKLLQTSE